MSSPANPAMIDVLDTFYLYVTTNLAKFNLGSLTPPVSLQGIVNAQDWPQREIVDGGLYLLYLQSVAVEEDSTRSQTYFEHFMQWAWVVIGTDLSSNQVGFNRGNRYRADMAIEEALRQSHFPKFCPKRFLSADGVSGVVTSTLYSPVEMIHWSMPRFGIKLNNPQSGVAYGAAPVEVYGWSTVSTLVNT